MLNIPVNSGVTTLSGLLVTADQTEGGSTLVQILIQSKHMGVETKKHILNAWNVQNFEECKKLLEKPVQFPALQGMNDEPYRIPKNSVIAPLKG